MIRILKYAVLALAITFGCMQASFAATNQDYRFEALNQPIKAAHDAIISVQITQLPANKTLTNAVIVSQSLHMIMGAMDEPTKIQPLPQDEKGAYRFSADLAMYGEWTIDLVTTMPEQKEPVKTSLKLQVVK